MFITSRNDRPWINYLTARTRATHIHVYTVKRRLRYVRSVGKITEESPEPRQSGYYSRDYEKRERERNARRVCYRYVKRTWSFVSCRLLLPWPVCMCARVTPVKGNRPFVESVLESIWTSSIYSSYIIHHSKPNIIRNISLKCRLHIMQN